MTQLKFRICVILLIFSLVLTIGSVVVLRNDREEEMPPPTGSGADMTQSMEPPSVATIPVTTQPAESTEETTEATTEPTTEPSDVVEPAE